MKRTNVIVILSDDQGIWAAGCYGNTEIKTPNIDRLAATGMRFDNFFVATPVCSPSRATLLTGRIPSQHGIHDWIKEGNVGTNSVEYLKGEICYTDILARNGYSCGISGKWHLGASEITQHGFADWFVHQTGGGDYNASPMVKNGEKLTVHDYITDVITDEAIAMLDTYALQSNPFYLSVNYTAPHSPWTGHPQKYMQMYEDCEFQSCPQEPRHPDAIWLTDENLGNRESLKGYFAAVTAMDYNIGRVMDRLQKLGIREETLVIFLSDNGFSCGQKGFWGKGNGTDPRNFYENSIRVPAIFSMPGTIPPDSICTDMVSAYDFKHTLLECLDIKPGIDNNSPGRSFACVLQDRKMEEQGPVVIFDEYGPNRMIRTERWKYVYRHSYGPDEFYDLKNDPKEENNLICSDEHKNLIKDLKTQVDNWFKKYVIPAPNGLSEDGRQMGQTQYIPVP